MTTLVCESVRDLLPEFVREELRAAEMAAVEAHLETCAECRAEHAAIASIRTPIAPLPAGFEQRVLRAVRSPRRAFFRPGRVAMAATVVFALVTAGVILETGLLEQGASSEESLNVQTIDWTSGDPVLLRGGLDLGALSEDELLQLLEEMDS